MIESYNISNQTTSTPNEAQSRVEGAYTQFGYTGTLTMDLSRQISHYEREAPEASEWWQLLEI